MMGGTSFDDQPKQYQLFRLLLTDSGHYIFPTDHERTAAVSRETKREAILFMQKVAAESLSRWDDVADPVKHSFLVNTQAAVSSKR